MRNPIYIILIPFFVFCQNLVCQNHVDFNQLKGENISTQSITYAIKQDSNGNIWIASEEGVLKHNSKFYKIYNNYKGIPQVLNNRVSELFIDSKSRIWIGLDNGLCKYDEKLDVFKIIKAKKDLNPSLVKSIVEDDNGDIWIGCYNGLWKYHQESNTVERFLSKHNIESMLCYKGTVFFGSNQGLYSYNGTTEKTQQLSVGKNTDTFTALAFFNNALFAGSKNGKIYKVYTNQEVKNIQLVYSDENSSPIKDILKTKNRGIYIATDGNGLLQLNNLFELIHHFKEDENNPSSLSSNGVYDIEYHVEDILWVATYGGGINYLDNNKLPFTKISHQINNKNSLVSDFTRAIAKDKNDNLWFGTKKGVSIFNKKTNVWKHLKRLSNNGSGTQDIVLTLQEDDKDMWIGTYSNGLFKVNINSLEIKHYKNVLSKIYALYKDSKGNLWVGGIEGDLAVVNKNDEVTRYPIQPIKSIFETRKGFILATGKKGIYRIDHAKKEFNLIERLTPNKSDLAYATINSAYETRDNRFVVATNGNGVVFYNPIYKTVKKLTVKSGMPSDIAQGIIAENDSVFWVSTTKGLANIITSKTDTIIHVYDKKDGLSSTEFNYGSYLKIKDSLFAFGGVDGVTLFNPKEVKPQNYKPKVEFDVFKLSNKLIGPDEKPLSKHINKTDTITLKHNENSIELSFTGISHSSSSKVKYEWKLEGVDNDWTIPSLNNTVSYNNLSPGNYTFKVKAYNKYSVSGKTRTLQITILPPWWATNTAFFIYFLLLVFVVYLIIHITSVIVKKKNADEQIDFFNNITHEIKTPLTILISSLDNVTENIDNEEDSKNRIKTTVKRINSLFEQMLNFQKITSTENLMMDLSKIKIEEHINKRINNFSPLTKERNLKLLFKNNWGEEFFYFDKDVFDKIILNLISNAIKYSFQNGKIYINLSKQSNNELKIEIIDEGLGIPKDQQKFILKRYYRARNVINSQRPGTGLGLMMVKKLLEKTGGTIEFNSEENKGTTFSLVLKNFKSEYKTNLKEKENAIVNTENAFQDQSEIDTYSNSKILIVEDNDELRDVVVKTLGVYFQVYEASNGKEGLKQASKVFPDIILTDLIMPEMDGMQMAKQLKEDINLNHIPIFMFTVLQNSEQKLESIETGISEYIEKPIDIKLLFAKIINTLKWQQKIRDKYVHDNEADNATLFRNKNDQEFLEKLEETVIKNIENESFSVHDLSGNFNMSRTSLYMKLKNLVDLSPQDFIIHTKLKFAKKLLIEGSTTIKEVAYQSGFSNPKYFSTSFKKFYKMTPTSFLDSLKKNEKEE